MCVTKLNYTGELAITSRCMEPQRVSFNAGPRALHRRCKPTDCGVCSAVLCAADSHVKIVDRCAVEK